MPVKPTGIELSYPCLLDCRADDDQGFAIAWDAPRKKGVEIRVYGVTTCFRTDAPKGKCLRRHTALPDDVRVLLAKGPASKGKLQLPLYIADVAPSDGWCAEVHRVGGDGIPVYSIVIAAYDANGHSVFAIASPGRYYSGECIPDVY